MIVDQNDTVRKYNYSSLITPDDDAQAVACIKSIIDSGNYFTNSPPFQTKENIFARPEPFWLKYRMSFLTSVFLYLGKEARVANMMAWSFMTNVDTQEDRNRYWHHHWHPMRDDSTMFSGIYYLHIPSDVTDYDTSGTEMAPNGPEKDGKYFVRPAPSTWVVYPSNTWHRPGILTSKEYRYVLAVDIECF